LLYVKKTLLSSMWVLHIQWLVLVCMIPINHQA
jgi:hypothetical protein